MRGSPSAARPTSPYHMSRSCRLRWATATAMSRRIRAVRSPSRATRRRRSETGRRRPRSSTSTSPPGQPRRRACRREAVSENPASRCSARRPGGQGAGQGRGGARDGRGGAGRRRGGAGGRAGGAAGGRGGRAGGRAAAGMEQEGGRGGGGGRGAGHHDRGNPARPLGFGELRAPGVRRAATRSDRRDAEPDG